MVVSCGAPAASRTEPAPVAEWTSTPRALPARASRRQGRGRGWTTLAASTSAGRSTRSWRSAPRRSCSRTLSGCRRWRGAPTCVASSGSSATAGTPSGSPAWTPSTLGSLHAGRARTSSALTAP
eukprot:2946516-Alexandrium_andersonii.AAC.1